MPNNLLTLSPSPPPQLSFSTSKAIRGSLWQVHLKTTEETADLSNIGQQYPPLSHSRFWVTAGHRHMNLLLLFILKKNLLQFSYFVNINCVIIFFSAYGHEREPPKIEHNLGPWHRSLPRSVCGEEGLSVSHVTDVVCSWVFLCVVSSSVID